MKGGGSLDGGLMFLSERVWYFKSKWKSRIEILDHKKAAPINAATENNTYQ